MLHLVKKNFSKNLQAQKSSPDPENFRGGLSGCWKKILISLFLFKFNCTKSYDDSKKFLDKITTPILTSEKANICEGGLVESELFKSLSSIQDCKSPGNDRLTKEFYKYIWNVTKDPLMNSIKEARKNIKLSISQRQAVTKLIEKKDRDKRYIKNWRPISLLNVDYKIMSKALATNWKKLFQI